MSDQIQTYLEEQLEAVVKYENKRFTIRFQREKIKLDHKAELDMLRDIDSAIKKDIDLTEDELSLVFQIPSNYGSFTELKNKDKKSRWIFTSLLLKKVMDHSLSRLHLILSPENIVMDESLMPYFLHYGVKESLPPYEKDTKKLWQELKATIAAAVDENHSFKDYLKLYETLQLSPVTAKIMKAEDENELSEIIRGNINLLEEREKEFVHVSQRKWKTTRYVALGLSIVLVPFLTYSLYSVFFTQPKQATFINSQEHFLKSDYSEVVSQLSDYKVEDMPRVVQFELAESYIINESLTEDQKENVKNTITLESDPLYYQYWIHIGRGSAKEALDIARSLEDRDLIVFALLKYREEIKADESLSGDEKQQEIKEVQSEIDEYIDEKEEQERELQEEQNKNEEAKEEQLNMEQQAPEQPSDEASSAQPAEGQGPTESTPN
jgi:type VII secretion protein EssB